MPRKPATQKFTVSGTEITVEWWNHRVYASGIIEISYKLPEDDHAWVSLLSPDGEYVVSGTAPLEEEDEDE